MISKLPALGRRQWNEGHLTLSMLSCGPPCSIVCRAKPPREDNKTLKTPPPIDQEGESIHGGNGNKSIPPTF